MTREDAKNIAYTWDIKATVNYEIKSIIFTSQTVSIIDKIYDDFESRTCENCKWYIKDKMECRNNDSEASLLKHDVYSDFGCNKFERKIDD